ncbi:MAG: hypothetical protein JXA97_07150 [Anaerolineales bacterium]|nr:hypothetical protein [Anaerolineales bacterium]
MKGEITLLSTALPVGGVREKALAAHRVGIERILFLKEKEADLHELPEAIRSGLDFILVDSVEDVLREVMQVSLPLFEASLLRGVSASLEAGAAISRPGCQRYYSAAQKRGGCCAHTGKDESTSHDFSCG